MRKTILSLIVSVMLPAATFAQPKLCGNVVNARGWSGSQYSDPFGIYSFDASDATLQLKTEATSRYMLGRGGGVADADNVYLYDVEMDGTYVYGTIYLMEKTEYNARTYARIGSPFDVPTAMTWDASTKNIYGCFYSNNASGYEFGVLTIASGRADRTRISKLSERIVALSDDDNGTLYAIGKSGMLYTISPTEGTLTEIGATGIIPSENIQCACYDGGIIYWAAQTSDNKSNLYKVDPTTGSATLAGSFPKNEHFSCLYKFQAAAEDDAPAAITDMTTDFEGPSLTGTLSFTLPDKTFAGEDLSGKLSWTVTKNGETIATGKGNAGETVTTDPLEFSNETNYVELYTENAIGRSPLYKTAFYVGPDIPSSVSWGEPKLSVDEERNATVTWPAVTSGVHGGYFKPEEVTYKVVRMPEGLVVADKLAATTFSEQLPEKSGITSYYYTVAAQFMGNESYTTETNKVNVGSGFEVPFEEQFNDGALDYWTVLDQNGDYTTWWLNDGSVYSQAGYDGGSDDWLISPAIHLLPGRYYKFAFRYWGGLPEYEDYKGQDFEVGFGKGTDPSTFQILGKKQNVILNEEDAEEFSAVVKVDEEGRYNFGIHDISPSDAYLLYIDSVTVTEGGTMEIPAPISDLTAVADAQGDLKVVISFTAPKFTAEDKPLETIDKIVIRRDKDTVVKTFTSPTPGEKLTFTDTEETGLTDGNHLYAVTSTNDKGESLEAEANVKVGMEIPSSVSNVVAEEQADGIHLSWSAPETDIQGNPINANALTYDITAVKYYTGEENKVATGLKGTSYTDTSFDLNGDQCQVYYIVHAANRAGCDEGIISNQLIVGKPYDLPITEGFSPEYDRQSKYLWWIDITQDINTMSFFRFATGQSSDGDNGCAVFIGTEEAFCNLRSGKINMQDIKNPAMTYDFYLSPDLTMYANLDIEYSVDLKSWTSIDHLSFESLDDPQEEEWRTHTVDLNPLAGLPCVYLRLHGELMDSGSAILVDNINIKDNHTDAINVTTAGSSVSSGKGGVFGLDGRQVSIDSSAESLRSLKPGVYMIGGRKVVIR